MEAVPLYKSRARELHTTSHFDCRPEQLVKRYETRGTERYWHKSPLSFSFFHWSLGASLFRGFKLTFNNESQGSVVTRECAFLVVEFSAKRGSKIIFRVTTGGCRKLRFGFRSVGRLRVRGVRRLFCRLAST